KRGRSRSNSIGFMRVSEPDTDRDSNADRLLAELREAVETPRAEFHLAQRALEVVAIFLADRNAVQREIAAWILQEVGQCLRGRVEPVLDPHQGVARDA